VAEQKENAACAGATPRPIVEGVLPNPLNPLADGAGELEPKMDGGGAVVEALPGGKT